MTFELSFQLGAHHTFDMESHLRMLSRTGKVDVVAYTHSAAGVPLGHNGTSYLRVRHQWNIGKRCDTRCNKQAGRCVSMVTYRRASAGQVHGKEVNDYK
jgi:hypothetical protein